MQAGMNSSRNIDTKRLIDAKAAIQSAFGKVVLALGAVPRYRFQTLSDLDHLVTAPLLQDCVIIAGPKPNDTDDDAQAELTPPAIVIWASVSQAVEQKIKEQILAGSFPIRLQSSDWRSGDKVWILDIIAPDEKLATDVLRSFNRISQSAEVSLHPIVTKMVDMNLLQNMIIQKSGDVSI